MLAADSTRLTAQIVRRRPRLILAVPLAFAAVSLLVAGCGGGGSPGVASVAASTTAATTTTQGGAVPLSHCMRSHGLPNFPDPQRVGGKAFKLNLYQQQQPGAGSPRFKAALRACRYLLPNGGVPQETAG